MSGHIVVVGSLNMDLVVRSHRHPKPGETILGGEFFTFPGGKGANQAVAASRIGAEVRLIGKVGGDPYGAELLHRIEQEGINTDFLKVDGSVHTGVALINVDSAGQNTIIVAPGANAQLTEQDIFEAEDAFLGASVLILQLEIPLPTVHSAISLALKHKVKVILNPAPAQVLDRDIYRAIDYLIPNETELDLLIELVEEESVIEKAERLKRYGAKAIIVTLGSQGALLVERDQSLFSRGHPTKVVDTTAAGDAFVGAFACAISRGLPAQEAVAWGNAAGACAVARAGAQPSLPTRKEIDMYLVPINTEQETFHEN
jgi:ribokinase